jgi:tRNA A37 N6-isopentenylltransferase MiaA
MLEAGMIDEVKILFERYPTSRALRAVGYRQTVAYLQGEAPAGRKIAPGLPGLEAEINLATRQLVKQQRTWFKGRPEAKWFIMNDHYDALMKELNAIRQANKF